MRKGVVLFWPRLNALKALTKNLFAKKAGPGYPHAIPPILGLKLGFGRKQPGELMARKPETRLAFKEQQMETSGWERKPGRSVKKLQTKDCALTFFELSEGYLNSLLAHFLLLAAIER